MISVKSVTSGLYLSIAAASLALAGSASTAHAALVQWTSATGGNDHWYDVIQASSGIEWEAARTAAIGAGGHLATITSADENAFVFTLVNNFEDYWFTRNGASLGPWLGGFQQLGALEPAGGFAWVTGEPFDFTAFAIFEPNNCTTCSSISGANEDRLHYFTPNPDVTASTWNDIAGAGEPLRSYVLEIDSIPTTIPLPAALPLYGTGLAVMGFLGWRRKRKALRN